MVSRRLQINLKTNPATSAGSLFLSWLRGLVVIESLDPLEDVRLPLAPGAFRDVKRLREVTIRRVRLFPDGTHSQNLSRYFEKKFLDGSLHS